MVSDAESDISKVQTLVKSVVFNFAKRKNQSLLQQRQLQVKQTGQLSQAKDAEFKKINEKPLYFRELMKVRRYQKGREDMKGHDRLHQKGNGIFLMTMLLDTPTVITTKCATEGL